MPTVTRLFGLWSLNSILAVLIMMSMSCLVSCSHNKNCENIILMTHVQLVSLSDTIPSDALFYEPYDVFIYLPKVGCSSCGSKDIAFLEAFIDKVDKEKTALITHIVNRREQKLLERQLGIRVYRLLDYRMSLFNTQTNRNGMIFRTEREGYATDILKLRYDVEEVCDYFEAINQTRKGPLSQTIVHVTRVQCNSGSVRRNTPNKSVHLPCLNNATKQYMDVEKFLNK